jgi:phosphoribosyl-dephospho-CoA transferase
MLLRHTLVYVNPGAWRDHLSKRPDVAAQPLALRWADQGWPFVVRRRHPMESGDAVPLALPLPPMAGKQRIAVALEHCDITATADFPDVLDALNVAPHTWHPCLRQLHQTAARYGIRARVFGSLGWQYLTGLTYLGPRSDLDVLLTWPEAGRMHKLLGALAQIDSAAPVRLDCELIRSDGAGVNWRELHAGSTMLALKTASGVALVSRDELLEHRHESSC